MRSVRGFQGWKRPVGMAVAGLLMQMLLLLAKGFPCAAWGGFPLPAILPCRGWLSPQQRNTCCSSAAWRCEMIAGMIALPGQEGMGHCKHLRGKPPKSQGKWGDSKTADLFSEQWHGVGWVSVPPRDGDSAAGFSYFPTVVQEQFVLINCEV